MKLESATNDDDVTHKIALALTEASQRGGSPQVSQTPSRRTESVMSSPARKAETKVDSLPYGYGSVILKLLSIFPVTHLSLLLA